MGKKVLISIQSIWAEQPQNKQESYLKPLNPLNGQAHVHPTQTHYTLTEHNHLQLPRQSPQPNQPVKGPTISTLLQAIWGMWVEGDRGGLNMGWRTKGLSRVLRERPRRGSVGRRTMVSLIIEEEVEIGGYRRGIDILCWQHERSHWVHRLI